ncbi:hypothetical protein [Treponema sp.]|uniref:hypothetical protein n=1 Tax=Treponema sp. TaxID=166 RepID=UPI00388DF80F
MKALVVADDEKAINNISQVLKSAGYDPIVYKWLLKALDNIEEICPHLIVISTRNYPRHWKTLAQYATNSFGNYSPQVILYVDENFNEEEQKKAEALKVRGCFDSIEVEGLDKLREILSKTDDIFSGYLTDEEQEEITVEDLVPNAKKYIVTSVESDEEIKTEEELSEKADETENTDDLPLETAEETQITEESLELTEETENFENSLESAEETENTKESLEAAEETEKHEDSLESDLLESDEEVPTVSNILKTSIPEESTTLPGSEELKEMFENETDENESDALENEPDFNKGETEAAEFSENENETELNETDGEKEMSDEQSLDEKLAEIMNANKADAKAKAEELNIDTLAESAVSFVFTNPITLAMVSGTARNYNGMTLEFTPDIPSFIMNLDAGTKISIASLKHNEKIENVSAEVMSNDSSKLYLTIKKFN